MTRLSELVEKAGGAWHVRQCQGTLAVRSETRGIAVLHYGGLPGGEQHQRALDYAQLIALSPTLASLVETMAGALRGFNVVEENVIGGTVDSLTVRISIKAIQDAAEALRSYHDMIDSIGDGK